MGRIAYWSGVVAVCYLIAIAVLQSGKWLGWQKNQPTLLSQLVPSLVISVLVAGFVYAVNLQVWGDIDILPNFLSYLAMTVPIALIISATMYFFIPEKETTPKLKDIAFFKRLPVHLGTDLYSLSVNDHYVEAETAKGTHMVLMRFSDALTEVENIDGLQIHRSHWIAKESVSKVDKRDGKIIITLKNAKKYPVSRSRLQTVKQALNV